MPVDLWPPVRRGLHKSHYIILRRQIYRPYSHWKFHKRSTWKKKKSWITVGHRVQYCYGCYFSSSRYHLHLLKKKKTLLIYTRELVDTFFKDFVLYSYFVWIQFFFEVNLIRLGWPNEISRNPRNRNQIYPSCFLPSKRR